MGIDWAAVCASVAEIRPKIRETLDFVAEQASDADEKIGSEITQYFATIIPDALAILGEVNKEIEGKTLTLESAKVYLEKLKAILEKVREHLKPTVSKLPGAVADKIRGRLDESFAQVGKIVHGIFELFQ